MTYLEPTLAAPMPPSSIDFEQVFAAQAERSAPPTGIVCSMA